MGIRIIMSCGLLVYFANVSVFLNNQDAPEFWITITKQEYPEEGVACPEEVWTSITMRIYLPPYFIYHHKQDFRTKRK